MNNEMSCEEGRFIQAFEERALAARANSVVHGFDRPTTTFGDRIALIHSELSEALEAFRHHNPPSEHIPEFTSIEEELADVVIRVMDLAAHGGYRVGPAVIAKMAFNTTRPFRHGDKVI